MRKTILIIGDDRMGRRAISSIRAAFPDIMIYRNRSNSLTRVTKLVKKKIIPFPALLQMVWAELRRPALAEPNFPVLYTNQAIRDMLAREKPDEVICFRAGLVLTEKTLACAPDFLNVHYY
ncbi:MAG: hypothetical protein C0582_01575 [Alphaproteobacteria bacterium]|nr:MAG: hypothetical protein C0582_01575 [Alphaproteobacteria bacterium]